MVGDRANDAPKTLAAIQRNVGFAPGLKASSITPARA